MTTFFSEVIPIFQYLPLQFNHTSVVLVLNAFSVFVIEGIHWLLACNMIFS